MNKIKLNPPETFPKDGSRVVAFFKYPSCVREITVHIVYWNRRTEKVVKGCMLDCDSKYCGGCEGFWFDALQGWIEIERFEL
jgi:hypothetical protein